MKYIIKEKFELGVCLRGTKDIFYHDLLSSENGKVMIGWSYVAYITLKCKTLPKDNDFSLKKKIKEVVDRFDHCTLVSKKDSNLDWVLKNSERVISTKKDINLDTVAKILFSEIDSLIKSLDMKIKLSSVKTVIDFADYEIEVKEDDLDKDDSKFEYSEAIFTS